MNIRGFLRWQFEGTLSNPSFYGFMLIVLGFIASVGGCPAPWPAVLFVSGGAVALIDFALSWFRFSYRIYELQQDQLMRELSRKEK